MSAECVGCTLTAALRRASSCRPSSTGVRSTALFARWRGALEQCRQQITSGKIRVGDAVVTDGQRRVRQAETIELVPNAPHAKRVAALDRSAIMYFDPHVVVVSKPAGISTVPYEERERGTLDQLVSPLSARLAAAGPRLRSASCNGSTRRPRGSSCSLARFAAKKVLGKQLRAHTMHRRYFALAHGRVRADHPLAARSEPGRRLRGTTRIGQGAARGDARRTMEVFEGATLVSCRLETGAPIGSASICPKRATPSSANASTSADSKALSSAPRPCCTPPSWIQHPIKGPQYASTRRSPPISPRCSTACGARGAR